MPSRITHSTENESSNHFFPYLQYERYGKISTVRDVKRDRQHKMILSLREHKSAMKDEDKEAFEMMLKRDRDDEDLDSIALQQLHRLHEQYVAKRSKEELAERWKKLTGG